MLVMLLPGKSQTSSRTNDNVSIGFIASQPNENIERLLETSLGTLLEPYIASCIKTDVNVGNATPR